MSSTPRSSRSAPVGPLLGALLVLVLGGSMVFAAWRFLQTSEVEPIPPRDEIAQGSADPVRHEPLDPGAIREESRPETAAVPTSKQSGSAPAAMTRALEDLARRSRGIDPDTPTHTVLGKVVDAQTQEAVIHFEIFLVPAGSGDPLQALERERPQKFRSTAGEFSLRYVLEGQYDVVVRTTTHADRVLPGGLSVPREDPLRIELDRGTWISGIVRDDYGQPLADKEVHLKVERLDPGEKQPQRRLTKTDKLGQYDFARLPPGVYSLVIGNPADPDGSAEQFYLGRDQHLKQDFEIDRQTTLKFVVKNELGKPVPRARVTLVSTANRAISRAAFSNLEGHARLHFVRPGEYRLTIHAKGYESVEEESYYVHGGDFLVEVQRTLRVAPR